MFSRKLWIEGRSQQISLTATIFFGFLLGGFIIAQAFLLSTIIKLVFLDHQTIQDIRPLIIGLVLVISGRGLTTFGRELSAGAVSIRVRSKLKKKMLAHLLKVGPILTSSEHTGEISTTIVQGVDKLDAYFREYLPQIFISAILPFMVLLVIFPIDWITGVVLLLTAPLIPLFMVLIGKQAEKEMKRQWDLLGKLGGHFLEVLQGLKTLKIFGLSKKQTRIIAGISDQYASATMKVLRISFLSALVLEILATISTAVIAVQIGIRLLYAQITLVDSLFILILAPDFYFPLRQLGSSYHAGMEGIKAADRIFEILSIPIEDDITSPKPRLKNIDMGELRFENVKFSYKGGSRPSLHGVNFRIPINMKTAFVGSSGSGKSTILFLLMKFIQPDSGSISYAGINLWEIDSSSWRGQLAWVPQFPYMFNDTVAANLLIAKPSATASEMIEASQKANLHEFIKTLPERYDTKIGESGLRFSGGQSQRLAIARAFLKNSPIFIFDEPSKNLDVESEDILQKTLDERFENKTILIAAHRISSIQSADQIVLMDQGKVIQVDSHRNLMENNVFYQNIVAGGREIE